MAKYNKSVSYFVFFLLLRQSFSSAINICTINIFMPEHGSCLMAKHKSAVH